MFFACGVRSAENRLTEVFEGTTDEENAGAALIANIVYSIVIKK